METNKLFLNKYKPIYFNEFDTNFDVINIINTLIKMNNLSILFIGDIGTGKTTFIDSTIKEYYKDYSSKDYNANILYINSLKEQGINYYRNDVRIFCQTSSSIINKKKIVILDDIDIINEQSQQIFRNYIDKYSHNVHFIASCSNSQKVIESLQSRFIIIKIKPIEKTCLSQIMDKIINYENINITNDAREFVINVCNNNVKVLINYMEKIKLLNKHIDINLVSNICTDISFFIFEEYTNFIKNKNLNSAVELFYTIYDKGYSVMDILDNYFLYIKHANNLTEEQKYNIIPIICKYITVFHNIHENEIELALFTNNLVKVI